MKTLETIKKEILEEFERKFMYQEGIKLPWHEVAIRSDVVQKLITDTAHKVANATYEAVKPDVPAPDLGGAVLMNCEYKWEEFKK